jgi:hypothetical protein
MDSAASTKRITLPHADIAVLCILIEDEYGLIALVCKNLTTLVRDENVFLVGDYSFVLYVYLVAFIHHSGGSFPVQPEYWTIFRRMSTRIL